MNNIYDFGLADAGGNLFVVPILSIFMLISQPNLKTTNVVLIVTLFYSITEIASAFFPIFGVFDFADLMAYLIGAIIILYLVNRLNLKKDKILRL